jgi:predicted RNA-binding Zn ribbon-like protein
MDWPWDPVGGHPALDLCNTRAWRRDPARDLERIGTPEDFARWYSRAVDAGEGARLVRAVTGDPDRATAGLRGVHALRDTLIGWLDAHVEGRGDPGAARAFARAWHSAAARATLAPTLPSRWTPGEVTDVRSAGDRLVLAAGELLHDPVLARLRRCAQDDCGWFFLDRTRNHSRRWCTADDCGNLARVRAYSARKKADGPRGPAVSPGACSDR